MALDTLGEAGVMVAVAAMMAITTEVVALAAAVEVSTMDSNLQEYTGVQMGWLHFCLT